MEIPPQRIRVKRKASEDAPVSFLRLQSNKRHRSEHFVYKLQDQDTDAPFADIPRPDRPIIHPSKPSAKANAAFQALRQEYNVDSKGRNGFTAPASTNAVGASASSASVPEPRRFHLSRKDMMLATSPYPSSHNNGGISKKRPAPALFVERRLKRLPSKKFETTGQDLHQTNTYESDTALRLALAHQQMDVKDEEPRKYKKPGVLAQKKSTTLSKPEVPKSILNRRDADPDTLAAERDQYALEMCGYLIQKAAEEEKERQEAKKRQEKERPGTPKSQRRFKPKPIKRYHERHPEVKQEAKEEALNQEATDSDVEMSSDDDYVTETYVRVPANVAENAAPHDMGLLVFDNDPDMDFFYGNEDPSDDEFEDDEDENAENYYTTDYPEDEIAWDDEYDRNAYLYRTGNASDNEEYDLVNGDFVDLEDKDVYGNNYDEDEDRDLYDNPFSEGYGEH